MIGQAIASKDTGFKAMTTTTHFTLHRNEQQILHLGFDLQDSSVNLLRRTALQECQQIMMQIEAETRAKTGPAGLILYSAKPTGFVYGADITEFEALETTADVAALMDLAHDVFNRLAALPIPTVALIDGIAVGGGLETALPCDYIIATASPKTQLGFPEINLGLMPGYGGTGRAVARIGVARAMEMVLSGKPLGADAALAAGLVDRLVDTKDALLPAAYDLLAHKPVASRTSETQTDIDQAIQHAQDTYLAGLHSADMPAPFAIIEHFRGAQADPARLIAAERDVFPELMVSQASHHLRRVFKITDKVRKSARGDSQINTLHVVGAGTMGGDIAAVAAMQGFHTTISDVNEEAVNAAIMRAKALFERRLKHPDHIAAACNRLRAVSLEAGCRHADLIIEAVAEDLDIKQALFRAIEAAASPEAILASNTSSILIEEIAEALQQPSRLIGLHFFNPVPVLPLVEVIASTYSDPELITRAMYFAGQMKKMPVKMASAKGFLVNRALLPYIYKAIELHQSGIEADRLDQAMIRFGMPMGPIELADQIGLDICAGAGAVIGISAQADAALTALMAAGKMGRKTGAGFYEWEGKSALRPRDDYAEDTLNALAEEMLAPLITQCRAAVEDGVVASADEADIACILGIGFPRYHGGPLAWAATKR